MTCSSGISPAGTTVRASLDAGGEDANSVSFDPSISTDGRYVAFTSGASDLVPGDGNFVEDVFVGTWWPGRPCGPAWTVEVGTRTISSLEPSMSSDGRFVAFDSYASDLVIGDANGFIDVFARNLATGTTMRASVNLADGDPDGDSYQPSISGDGNYVAYTSSASDLVAGDRNGTGDVFARDMAAGTILRASVDTGGGDPNGYSFDPSMSIDGRYVAFASYARDLVHGAPDHGLDVFVARWS